MTYNESHRPDAPFREILTPDPAFKAPLRLPGRPDQVLSPSEYGKLTDQSRDPTLAGADWGLVEEPIETVGKDGIQLFGMEYMATELIPYTSGDKVGPRPKLVARYDRALAARGLLKDVKVLEILEGGHYRPLCVATPRHEFNHAEASGAVFLAFRREYVRVLLAKRTEAERRVSTFSQQDQELKAHFDRERARSRRKRSGKRDVSAQPITLKDLRKEEDKRLGTVLQETAPNIQAPPTSPKRKAGGVRRSGTAIHATESDKSNLGDVLGGMTGFVGNENR